MKKKGFTLIELLAVIVILAIIALIATPLVLKYIEKSRQESKVDSAYSFVRNLETEIANYSIKNNGKKYNKSGLVEIGDFTDIDTTVKGDTPSNGKVCLSSLGQVDKAILQYDKYYVLYDGKKGSISDKDTYDNFSCSDGGNDAVSNHIIDADVEFTYDESQSGYIATLPITKEIAGQFVEGYDYDLVIDNGESNLIYAVSYIGTDLMFDTHVNDLSKLKGIKVNEEKIEIGSMEELLGLHNVKITNKRPVEERLYFKIDGQGEIYLSGYDLVKGNAKVLIKDESGEEYFNNTITLSENNEDGIIGADGCSRDNLPLLPNVYTDLTNGKTITIEITQTVNGKEVVSTVTKNLNSMMIFSNQYFSRYYILLIKTLHC